MEKLPQTLAHPVEDRARLPTPSPGRAEVGREERGARGSRAGAGASERDGAARPGHCRGAHPGHTPSRSPRGSTERSSARALVRAAAAEPGGRREPKVLPLGRALALGVRPARRCGPASSTALEPELGGGSARGRTRSAPGRPTGPRRPDHDGGEHRRRGSGCRRRWPRAAPGPWRLTRRRRAERSITSWRASGRSPPPQQCPGTRAARTPPRPRAGSRWRLHGARPG